MSEQANDIRKARPGSETRQLEVEPDFSKPVKPIAEFVARDDFPECVLGEHVDIGGYSGVVTSIVRQSIRVKSQEGGTQGFNMHSLRRIYGPRTEPAATPATAEAADAPAQPAPAPETVEEPDFEQPVVPISELAVQPDFPKAAFGRHVDIAGYTGVVVEIVNESLKVRSQQGSSRNYNVPVLRKLYGKAS